MSKQKPNKKKVIDILIKQMELHSENIPPKRKKSSQKSSSRLGKQKKSIEGGEAKRHTKSY